KSRRQPPVFAGAVKGSQLHLFATIINWFIAHGHPASGAPPVDPGWDVSRAAMLADNEAVTMLLATLAAGRGDGYFCPFAVRWPRGMSSSSPCGQPEPKKRARASAGTSSSW